MDDSNSEKSTNSDAEFDAFLSHSSADRRCVARIQSFLEAYRFGDPKRRVKVFRDYSDLPAGELFHEIEQALAASRFLVVVSSPAAAESRWVDKEIRAFDTIHDDSSRISVAVLDGPINTEVIEALKSRDYLRHDLRRGWILGIPRLRTRLGLLRVLAMLTGQSMRSLVKWHLLRTLQNWSLATLIALFPFVLFMLQSVPIWDRIEIEGKRGRVYSVWAEIGDNGELKVAYRFRGQGGQGFRNYFAVIQDALQPESPAPIHDRFESKRRLLPTEIAEWDLEQRLSDAVNFESVTDWPLSGDAFIGNPRNDHFVLVQPLGLTEEEKAEAHDDMIESSVPIPTSKGSVIATVSPNGTIICVVDDLSPYWKKRDWMGNPTSPSMGLPIVWDDELGIWLGVPGWDGQSAGGLWRSNNSGRSWDRVGEFKSVNSLGVVVDGGVKCLVVSELHFDTWAGILLVPYPSRAVLSRDGGDTWIPADTPPFGSRSEIEFAGTLKSGYEVFRIDENLFQQTFVQRWQALLSSQTDPFDARAKGSESETE